jgi:hypothetical protein
VLVAGLTGLMLSLRWWVTVRAFSSTEYVPKYASYLVMASLASSGVGSAAAHFRRTRFGMTCAAMLPRLP